MTATWDELFDRAAASDGDRESIRAALESIREENDG